MNRNTLIGLGSVGVVGVVLAALAVFRVDAVESIEATAEATVQRREPKVQRDGPSAPEDEDNILQDIADRTARIRARAPDSSRGEHDPSNDLSQQLPPAPPALQDAEMSQVFAEERALLEHNPFADLGPGASLDALGRRVGRVEAGVDELAQEYQQLASVSDAGTAVEALNRAALLYDHMSGQIPLYPPTDLPPSEMDAWRRRHDSMVRPLQDKAHALRQRASELALSPNTLE